MLGRLAIPAALAWTALAGQAVLWAGQPIAPIRRSPYAKLQSVDLDAARWTEGFWADRFRLCHTTVLPKMNQALEDPQNGACLSNFRVAAGLEPGMHRGTNWSDGDCYKWIEAMAHVYAVTRDEALDRQMDGWIDLIAKSQAEDGYLATQTQLDPRKKRWGARVYHELYNMGHLMTAACVHYRATGKESFLLVARRVAEYLDGVFKPRPPELAHFGWNPSNIMGLVDLYRATGQRRWLELAGIFVEMRGSAPWPRNPGGRVLGDDPHPGDQTQDRVPLRKETEAVGHAVTAAYLYCGAADLCAETGEKALFEALQRIWENVAEKKMYVTGGIGAYHHGVSSRFDMVHEAFGREYELPNRTAYNETCANIAQAMWSRRMAALTGEAKYADVMELVLYNSALSGMSLDGTRFCYCNPLARRRGVPLLNNDTPQRWTLYKCYCCPPNLARTLAQVHQWAYSLSEGAVWVNLYGGSTLSAKLPSGGTVQLAQETRYPWDGKVTLRIEQAPPTPLAVMMRVPGWADRATIRVNGKTRAIELKPGTYAELRRQWSPGERIELDLPMEVAMLQAHPLVEELRNQVAVKRGPIVYCLESTDLPEGVRIDDVHLPRNAHWVVRHVPDLLGGVTVLETEAWVMPGPGPSQQLYRKLPRGKPRRAPIRLIPYYAWNNRGEPDMSVWIPLGP
ncbi:MAG: glycoside hydrolase family 127 protein [Thermoguttaceae bacterium]